jgi:inner membrane protein
MDSLSQLALGAACTVAVMGRRTSVGKAAAWGAVLGTLPDLDAFIDHGDPLLNMVLHRADSHSLFYLTLLAPLLGAAIARLSGEAAQWRRWTLAAWVALFTHPLLDLMTVYGTQLARPFTDHPYAVGSVFIIDPLYTLPLLAGLGVALASRQPLAGLRANLIGLALSTFYLVWGVAAQQHVSAVARHTLQAQGVEIERLLVTPTAFNSVLWRVLAMSDGHYREGYHSLLDAPPAPGQPAIAFERFEQLSPQAADWLDHPAVQRLAAFSQGHYKLETRDARVLLTDLRMGQEPYYTFTFDIGRNGPPVAQAPEPVVHRSERIAFAHGWPWLWRRALGQALPPPR